MWTFVAGARLTSSELVATEVRRGLQRNIATKQLVVPLMSVVVAEIRLEEFTLHPIDGAALRHAAKFFEPNLGSLDAIHVVTAFAYRPVDAFVTYDIRQAQAARKVGLPIVSPGMKG
jgi:predicted nucleic acid-binding protein